MILVVVFQHVEPHQWVGCKQHWQVLLALGHLQVLLGVATHHQQDVLGAQYALDGLLLHHPGLLLFFSL
jgi:hypothetical protein